MAKTVLLGVVAVVLLSCGVLRAEEGAEAAGKSGLFSGTIADSAWTVAAFVTLVLVLTKVAWKPLLNGLKTRQGHIEQQIRSAEDSRQKAEKMLEDYRQQGQTVVRQATDEAQRHRQQTLEQAREEVLALRRRAHEEVESARTAAMEELWRQTGEIVLRVSSEVLARTLTPQDNQRLVDEAVAQVKRSGGL
jgi:F-type H+-transporting ATPase subunit b